MFCAALPQEIKHFCRQLDIKMPDKHNRVSYKKISENTEIGIAVSGVGQSRMKNLLDSISDVSVTYWVSIGFAGGLGPVLQLGDCIIGHKVLTSNGLVFSDANERNLIVGARRNILYCADKIVATPEEKQSLHEKTGAWAVDMESAVVARHAKSRGERFAWIRVISDAADETVPEEVLSCVTNNGFPSSIIAIKTILFNPLMLKIFIKLGLRSVVNSRRLSNEIYNSGLIDFDS